MRYCQGDEKENAIMFALLELCSNIHVTMPHVDLHSRKMCQMRNFYARVVAAREFLQSRSAIGCIGDILHALGSTTPQYPRPPCNLIFTAHCGTNLPLSDARSMTSLRRRSSHCQFTSWFSANYRTAYHTCLFIRIEHIKIQPKCSM